MSEPMKLVRIQLATVGSFKGHAAGPFELSPKVFDEIVRNFRNRGLPVPIDAEHASESDPADGTIPVTGTPAWGWIHDIINEGLDGLWGMVEWLEPARTYIKEGKYRYLSPAIRFNSSDPVTGKPCGARLSSAGCTNVPFLNMAPLVAAKHKSAPAAAVVQLVRMTDAEVVAFNAAAASPAERASLKASGNHSMNKLAHDHNEAMPRIREALGLHEITTPAEVMERCKALREMCATADAGGMSGGVPVADYCDRLTDVSDVPMGATVEDVFNAIEAIIQAACDEQEAGGQDDAAMKAALKPVETKMGDDMKAADMATSKAKMEDDMKAKMDDAEMATSKAKMAEEEAAKAKMAADMATSKAKMAEEEAAKAKMDDAEMATSKAKMAADAAAKAKMAADMATSKAKMAADEAEKAKMSAAQAVAKMNAALSAPKDELARQFTMKDGAAVKMTKEEIMAESIAMKDVTTKLSLANAEVAKLTLQLNAKATHGAELEAEIVRLKAEGEARDKAEIEARITDAFETHRDSMKLTDKHLSQMRVFCKSDRQGFDDLYPVLRGPKKMLLRDLSSGRAGDTNVSSDAGAKPPVPAGVEPGETPNDTAVRLTLADPTLDLADAQIRALKMHASARL